MILTAGTGLWQLAGAGAQIAAAAATAIAGGWIVGRRERFGSAGTAVVAGLFLTALFSLSIAAVPVGGGQELFAAAANLAWLYAVYRLFASDGRDASLAPIRPVVVALTLVELIHMGVQVLVPRLGMAGAAADMLFQSGVLFRLLVAIGGLVLVHNLYAGAAPQARLVLRWPALALCVFWGFDLNLYTIAYLSKSWPVELAAMRGIALVAVAILMVLGAARGREQLRFRPSRTVAFQSISLLVIGVYLAAMFGIAKWLTYAGGNVSRLMALAFLAAGLAAMLVLPSRRLRGSVKVTLAKHLFQHRYDYRAEWLRFTRTIGQAGAAAAPLEERVVQAVADIADAPAGLLLAAGDQGELTLAARWQWPSADVPGIAMSGPAIAFFERTALIVDIDDLRAGRDLMGETAVVPAWLIDDARAWALIPLIHYERLTGVVVLARPPHSRKFDWEDFDLLRVAGQQLASYLAEHAGQAALAEANRFDDFHRRIAFVMHDIKNLASQLSLLARNAELHADKPDFRADMLVTLRNSADKLNALLARLSRYGAAAVERLAPVDAEEVLRQRRPAFPRPPSGDHHRMPRLPGFGEPGLARTDCRASGPERGGRESAGFAGFPQLGRRRAARADRRARFGQRHVA